VAGKLFYRLCSSSLVKLHFPSKSSFYANNSSNAIQKCYSFIVVYRIYFSRRVGGFMQKGRWTNGV
jgi:hypothetical protein